MSTTTYVVMEKIRKNICSFRLKIALSVVMGYLFSLPSAQGTGHLLYLRLLEY